MFCSNCGKEIIEGSKFCKYCGEKVLYEEVHIDAEPSDKNKKIVKIIGFVLVGVLFALASIAILVVFDTQKNSANNQDEVVKNDLTKQSEVIVSDNSSVSENVETIEMATTSKVPSINADLASEDGEPTGVQFTQEEMEKINLLVEAYCEGSPDLLKGELIDLSSSESDIGRFISVVTYQLFYESPYNIATMESGESVFTKEYENEIRELFGIEMGQVTNSHLLSFGDNQYYISIGNGFPSKVSLANYRVENNQVIISGTVECYEDESLQQLVQQRKIEAIGERNEKSSFGHFKLNKVQFVDE